MAVAVVVMVMIAVVQVIVASFKDLSSISSARLHSLVRIQLVQRCIYEGRCAAHVLIFFAISTGWLTEASGSQWEVKEVPALRALGNMLGASASSTTAPAALIPSLPSFVSCFDVELVG